MIPLKVNADYEVQLFHQQLAPVAINQSIEFLLFFLSDRPLFGQKSYSPDYLDYVKSLTGRTPVIVGHGPFENYWGPLKNIESERWWNSKLTSSELLINNGWCPDTHIISQETDLKNINWDRSLLLKDPFGMSGQKFQILSTDKMIDERVTIVKKAMGQGPVILEPWLNRKFDFSQYVFPSGKIIAYQNQVDLKFQYKGTLFPQWPSASLEDLDFYSLIDQEEWATFHQRTQTIMDFYSTRPNECGYSIDSFVYEEKGKLKVRVMSEINYRLTMGRVAYELAGIFSGRHPWNALLLAKTNLSGPPLWKQLPKVEGLVVLSPGDSRFEMIFVSAENPDKGRLLIQKANDLLADGQFSIEI
jgi:hypothetical protein